MRTLYCQVELAVQTANKKTKKKPCPSGKLWNDRYLAWNALCGSRSCSVRLSWAISSVTTLDADSFLDWIQSSLWLGSRALEELPSSLQSYLSAWALLSVLPPVECEGVAAGNRTFLMVAPRLWHSLSLELGTAPSLKTFRKGLKTLFQNAFEGDSRLLFLDHCVILVVLFFNVWIY